jgi:hypothetical protein
VLRAAIAVPAGAFTLDIDIPVSRVTGEITVAGAPLPATVTSTYAYDGELYLVAQDTRLRHRVATIDYSYDTGSTYRLVAGTDRLSATLVPGVYDLVFQRARNTGSTYDYVSRTNALDPLPTATRVVQSGVVVPAGDFTLDVDIPLSRVTGMITVAGGALPPTVTSAYAYDAELYLVARDTGLRHRVACWQAPIASGRRSSPGLTISSTSARATPARLTTTSVVPTPPTRIRPHHAWSALESSSRPAISRSTCPSPSRA